MATGLLSSSISICKTCTCNQSSYICHFIDPAAGSGWGSKRITKTRHCLSFLKIWQNILTAKKKKNGLLILLILSDKNHKRGPQRFHSGSLSLFFYQLNAGWRSRSHDTSAVCSVITEPDLHFILMAQFPLPSFIIWLCCFVLHTGQFSIWCFVQKKWASHLHQ